MATEEAHLLQFERNQATARRLAASSDYDWGVVALFYAALHLVQAYFVHSGVHVQSHRHRDRQILATDEVRPVFERYVLLRVNSEQARYECRRFSREEFEGILDGSFRILVEHMQSLRGGT